jgi:outer membrane lipoprotein-sorting protein
MKKYIVLSLFSILLALFVISFIQAKKQIADTRSKPVVLDENNRAELEQIGNEVKNMLVRDIHNDTLEVSNIIKGTTVIIYNPKISCQPCFDSLVSAANNFLSEFERNVIVLSRFYSLRDIKFFQLKNNNTSFSIYDILTINPECFLDRREKSTAFVCDTALSVSQLFIYDSKNKHDLDAYLSNIKALLKSSTGRR